MHYCKDQARPRHGAAPKLSIPGTNKLNHLLKSTKPLPGPGITGKREYSAALSSVEREFQDSPNLMDGATIPWQANNPRDSGPRTRIETLSMFAEKPGIFSAIPDCHLGGELMPGVRGCLRS